MSDLNGKRLFITGTSRGIGKAIAVRAARDGARIAIAAKTDRRHPKLPGTIHTAAEEIREAGGEALPLKVDIRDEAAVAAAVAETVEAFGGLDILVNNASAIYLAGTIETPMKRFDLMWGVNARGTYVCSQACLPHLLESENPHILNLSPPLHMEAVWFKNHVAYSMAKYGMSLCVLGMAEEFRDRGVGVNALWPRTVIDTAALRMLGGMVDPANCRKPEILADAAHCILTSDARETTGNFFVDDEVLAAHGVEDLERYAVSPGEPLLPDFFLPGAEHVYSR
jgi:citronellol/citronellal dehydrogenase